MALNNQEIDEVIEAIDEADLHKAFSILNNAGIKDDALKRLEKEYIHGNVPFDYSARLKIYVNSLRYPIRYVSKSFIYIILIILISIGSVYFFIDKNNDKKEIEKEKPPIVTTNPSNGQDTVKKPIIEPSTTDSDTDNNSTTGITYQPKVDKEPKKSSYIAIPHINSTEKTDIAVVILKDGQNEGEISSGIVNILVEKGNIAVNNLFTPSFIKEQFNLIYSGGMPNNGAFPISKYVDELILGKVEEKEAGKNDRGLDKYEIRFSGNWYTTAPFGFKQKISVPIITGIGFSIDEAKDNAYTKLNDFLKTKL
ncbi:MAG: hypothetical protein MUE81_05270 [Thermoflexibacter sp.]|nr:hypothetical protein [Thermoflexibacter sp.]